MNKNMPTAGTKALLAYKQKIAYAFRLYNF